MALIECTECHKEISSKAETCPHCGNPIKVNAIEALNKESFGTQLKVVSFYFGLILMPFIFAWFTLKKGFSKTARIFSFAWLILWVMALGINSESPKQEVTQSVAAVSEVEEKSYLLQGGIDFDELLLQAKPSKTSYYDAFVESVYIDRDRLSANWLTIVVFVKGRTIRGNSNVEQFSDLDRKLITEMAQNAIGYLVETGDNPDVYDFDVKVTARLEGSSPTGKAIVYPMGSVRYFSGGTDIKYLQDF